MKLYIILSSVVFCMVLGATLMGIFDQTPGAPVTYTMPSSERAVTQGYGLYRNDPAWYAQAGIIWDVINLAIGAPLLGVAIYLSWRHSLRGRLLLNGLLFYFFYVYLMTTTANAFNRLFLVYTAIFALSAVAFFLNLYGLDVPRLPEQVSERFPRRLFIGFSFGVAAILLFLWLGRIMAIMAAGRFPPELAGATTLETQGLDLGLVVPLMLSAGILLWRRSPWGYLLAGVSTGYGLLMSITLPAFIVVPLLLEGKTNIVEAVPFSLMSLAGFYFVWMFYKNVRQPKTQVS